MPHSITQKHNTLILDSCCLLNLYASRRMADVVAALAEQVTVAAYVKDEEALNVYRTSKRALPLETERVDLQPLLATGLVQVVDLQTTAEKQLFAVLTTQRLDDGEAISLALAIQRQWAIATDDKIARRLCGREYPHLEVVSTPQLFRHWADVARPTAAELTAALRDTQARANYAVSPRDPLYSWWHSQL